MSRIKKLNFYVVHIHTRILLNHKNKIIPFAATWVQLEISVLSEVRKRKTNTIWYHLYVESKRKVKRKKVKSLSRVRFFVTLWTVAHQAPPSMGFSRQEYWSGLPFPSPGDLPDLGMEPESPALQENSSLSHQGSPSSFYKTEKTIQGRKVWLFNEWLNSLTYTDTACPLPSKKI